MIELNETTVGEFLNDYDGEVERIVGDLFEYLDFLKQKGKNKFIREEHIPIRAFLLRHNVPRDTRFALGGEAYSFDAKLIYPHGEETLEVVQALPKDEHRVRHALVDGKMTAELRHLEMEQLRSFPQPIIDAIRKKVARGYADARTLLVSVIGEHTYEDDDLIASWIPQIKADTIIGNFKAVYLVETARSKLFRIH